MSRHLSLIAALSVAACSGEPPDSQSGVAGLAANPGAASDDGAAAVAHLQFVNYWVHEDAGAPVDVYVRAGLGREEPLFEGVGFAETASAAIPADATVLAYRAGEPDGGQGFGAPSFIASEDLGHDIDAGVPLTAVLTYAQPLGEDEIAGAIDVFYDAGDYVIGGMPARPVEGALLVAFVSPAGRVLGDANEGFRFGIPDAGCLRPAATPSDSSITVSVGGTAALTYDVEPGAARIAAYALGNGQCAGTPDVGPVEVEIAPGRRTYLFAYGTGPDDLRLMAVSSSAGE